MDEFLREGERYDDLGRNGYVIIQNPNLFCFGMDAVLLTEFVRVAEGEKVLDLGTGTGIIPILLEAKTKGGHFTGLELSGESADMARRSVRKNGLEKKIEIVTGDIKDASKRFGASSFDIVTSNPPYMIGGHGLKNDSDALTMARHEVEMTLEDLIRETSKLLRVGGRCFFVHRPFRLVELFCMMHDYGLEPKRMRMVYPFADKEPNMVLVEGVRGGRPRLTVEKPLIVYEKKGVYTAEVQGMYDPKGERG